MMRSGRSDEHANPHAAVDAPAEFDRSAVPDNRRTYMVTLTARGRRVFRKMAERHEQWVIALLGHLEAGEVEQLMHLLNRVKQGA